MTPPSEVEKKYPANFIVKFICRKKVSTIHYNKKNLYKCKNILKLSNNIMIVENLCSANRAVLNECRKLKFDGVIYKYWTRNGFVRFKYTENEDKHTQINQFDELIIYCY